MFIYNDAAFLLAMAVADLSVHFLQGYEPLNGSCSVKCCQLKLCRWNLSLQVLPLSPD